MNSRRNFFKFAGIAGGALAASAVSKVALAALPEITTQTSPDTMPPLVPDNGRPYNPVVTLNGWTLPWRMKNGVRNFIWSPSLSCGKWHPNESTFVGL
jgi:hypothetical protein